MRARSQRERYEDELGEDALERQRRLAKERFVCCGEPNSGPHHFACSFFVEPELPVVIEGQESLLG